MHINHINGLAASAASQVWSCLLAYLYSVVHRAMRRNLVGKRSGQNPADKTQRAEWPHLRRASYGDFSISNTTCLLSAPLMARV